MWSTPYRRRAEVPLQSALRVQWACSGQHQVYTDLPTKLQDSRSNHKKKKQRQTALLVSVGWLAGFVVGLLLKNNNRLLFKAVRYFPKKKLNKINKNSKTLEHKYLVLCFIFLMSELQGRIHVQIKHFIYTPGTNLATRKHMNKTSKVMVRITKIIHSSRLECR